MKKILIVNETLGYGGAERLLVNLLPYLKEIGYDIKVCVLKKPVDLADELKICNIEVENLNVFHRWAFPEIIKKLNKLIKKFNPDIIWGNLYFGILYSRLSKLLNKNIYCLSHLHYHISHDTKDGLWYKIRNKIFDFSHIFDNATIAVSQSIKNDYEKFFDWKDIKVIYNAIDISKIRKSLGDFEKIKKLYFEKYNLFNKKIITIPGRLHESKGHKYLLEAISQLPNNENFKVFVIGDGPNKNNLIESCKKLRIEEIVEFLGNKEQSELFNIEYFSDIIVIPSIFEAFGLAAIEAMSLKKPVVLSEIDAFNEFAENRKNSILVPPKDSKAIAHAITDILDNEKLKNKISLNAELTAKMFDVKNIVFQWDELFKGVN